MSSVIRRTGFSPSVFERDESLASLIEGKTEGKGASPDPTTSEGFTEAQSDESQVILSEGRHTTETSSGEVTFSGDAVLAEELIHAAQNNLGEAGTKAIVDSLINVHGANESRADSLREESQISFDEDHSRQPQERLADRLSDDVDSAVGEAEVSDTLETQILREMLSQASDRPSLRDIFSFANE